MAVKQWNVVPTVFPTGVVAGIALPQCAHCGRGALPLILFGDQTHATNTPYALVCQDCVADARKLLQAVP